MIFFPAPDSDRPSSPFTEAQVRQPTGYILQPPLPDLPARQTGSKQTDSKADDRREPVTAVPILLNPDILQHTAVPIISPQVRAGFRMDS